MMEETISGRVPDKIKRHAIRIVKTSAWPVGSLPIERERGGKEGRNPQKKEIQTDE